MNPEDQLQQSSDQNKVIATFNRLFIEPANRNRQADKQTSFSRPFGA